jgi:hypothetical protein
VGVRDVGGGEVAPARSSSTPMASRSSRTASAIVVPMPHIGSTIKSPGSL